MVETDAVQRFTRVFHTNWLLSEDKKIVYSNPTIDQECIRVETRITTIRTLHTRFGVHRSKPVVLSILE